MEKFAHPSLSSTYLAAHALKRAFLGQVLGCDPKALSFETTDKGKPLINGPASGWDWHFNLSHTKTMVVMAISRHPVGIDIENISRRVPDIAIAKRYFSTREYERLATSPTHEQSRLFFRYWTLKEAFLKAEGWGLSQRLDAVEFALSEEIQMSVLDPIAKPTQAWRFWQQQPNASHLMSLALVSTATDLELAIDCRQWQTADWSIN
jgi:4'-phosphopantetheinyl transferase